jgi:hypothetical protein
VGFDLNTIHGIKFFERVSVSAGISLDWNINKTFLSTPYIIDLRVFSGRSNQDGSLLTYKQVKTLNGRALLTEMAELLKEVWE